MLVPSLAVKHYNCFDGYILELASSIHDRETQWEMEHGVSPMSSAQLVPRHNIASK